MFPLKNTFGIPDALESNLAVCYRLNQRSDSGNIAQFNDALQGDRWLPVANDLQNSNMQVSISAPICCL